MPSYNVTAPDGAVFRVDAPEGATLDDAINYAATNLYPEYLAKKKPEEKQSFLRSVADIPIQFSRGIVGTVANTAAAFGADNALATGARELDEYISSYRSAQSRKDSDEMARIMEEAKDKGFGAQLYAAAKAFTVAPLDLLAQGVGSFVIPAAAGRLAGAPAMLALGAAQGAGSVKSAIYEETKRVLLENGVPADEAEARAVQAQAYNGQNLGQILLGAGLGSADAVTGVDRIFRGAKAAADTGKSFGRRAVSGFAGEAPLEALQGGQEQYASNVAVQNEGITRDPFENVVTRGALEGIVGGVTGSAIDVGLGKRPGPPTTDQGPETTSGVKPEEAPVPRTPEEEEAAKKRDEYRPDLYNLGWTDEDIDKVPLEDLGKIATGGIHPDDYFFKKKQDTTGTGETPSPTPPEAPTPVPPETPTPVPPKPQKPSVFEITKSDEAKFESAIPGVVDVIRQIHQRMFPGTIMRLQTGKGDFWGLWSPYTSSGPLKAKVSKGYGPTVGQAYQSTITIDIDKIFNRTGGKKDAASTARGQAAILQTLFHELAHPLQYQLLSQLPAAQQKEVIDQYVKERNPTSIERILMFQSLQQQENAGAVDDATLAKALAPFKLTLGTYKSFMASEAKAAKLGKGVSEKTQKYLRYTRNFPEWIAETGAKWYTKELEGLVPRTTFERFQKSVLDGLRTLFNQISTLLGITPTEGAFQRILRENYGTRFETGPIKGTIQDTRIIKGRSGPTSFVAPQESVADPTENVSRETPERRAKIDAATAQIPADAKGWKDYGALVRNEPRGMFPWFNKLMRSLTGAEPGESLGKALLRNTVLSTEPFLARADTRNLGKFLEGLLNSTGRVMGVVTMGPLGWNPKTKSFFIHKEKADKSLLKIFEKVGVQNMEQAQIVFLAQRELALRAAKQVGTVSKTGIMFMPVTNPATGEVTQRYITTPELRAIVASASKDVLEASREFQAFNDKMVQMAIDTGLIPASLGEKFKTLMYTPMYRAQDEALKQDRNITLGDDVYKAIRDPESINAFNKQLAAGGAIHGNLYENILRNYNAIVSAAVRNVAYQETARTLTDIKKAGGDDTIAEIVSKPGVDKDTGRATITYRVNGEDRHMLIHDAPMFQAVAALSPKEKNEFVRQVGFFTGLLRKGVTSTPGFILTNLIRGLVELKIKTGMPITDIVKGTLGAVSDVWNKKGAYSEIVGQTGFGGFGFGSGYRNQAEYMQRVYKSKEQPLNVWNNFARVFDTLEHIGEVTEMAPRIAYYNYLQTEKGGKLSKADAAWEAVNLVNYHRSGAGNGTLGTVVTNLIPLTPFLTARIQGLYRLVETGTAGAPDTLIGKDKTFGITKQIITRGAMVFAINAAVNFAFGDDDWYKKLSVKDRLSNMYIKVGDTVIALPRAFEIGELFGALPTLALDSIRKNDGNDIAQGVIEFGKKTFFLEVIPQFAKPLEEIYANRNAYTGQDIETLADKRKPKEERYDEYTSSIAKYAGQVSAAVGLSPKQVDALIRGYTGSMGMLFLTTVDGITSAGGTRPAGVFGDPASVPGILGNISGATRILKTEGQINNKFIGDFYEIKQKVTEIATSMTDAAKIGDTETIKKRLEQMPAARGLYTAFNAASENMSKLNSQIDIIRRDPRMTPERKAELLERLNDARGKLAEQMVNAANRAGVYR